MAREKLTNDAIKQARADAAKLGKRIEIWDETQPGLFVVVSPSPKRAPTFFVKYRAGRLQRKLKLGRLGPQLTLPEARRLAKEKSGDAAKGRDPQAERKAEREALLMVDLLGSDDGEDPKAGKLNGWYLSTYVKTAGKLDTAKKAKSAKTAKGIANDRYAIAKHLRSRRKLVAKRVDEVRPEDLRPIAESTTAATWRKLRNILLVVFRYAEEQGAVAPGRNPVLHRDLKATADAKRSRFLSPEERQRLEAALQRAEEIGRGRDDAGRYRDGGLLPSLVRVIKLLALTGMRRGDVLSLRWEWVDWRHAVIKLPIGKTGARDVPLSPHAVDYLKRELGELPRLGLICTTATGGPIHPENVERAWQSIRERAKLDGSDGRPAARLHDLRHSWASDAVSAGVPLYVVAEALGHTQVNTTKRYAHLHDTAIREAMKVIGAAIDAATSGRRR